MNINLSLAPLVALLAGILILVMPRLLNYIVAIYLIVTGLLGLFGGAGGSFHTCESDVDPRGRTGGIEGYCRVPGPWFPTDRRRRVETPDDSCGASGCHRRRTSRLFFPR